MSEMRDLQEDKRVINEYWEMDVIDDGEDIAAILTIAERNIDRAIAAEKDRDELRKRVEELENILLKAKYDIHAGAAGFALQDINRYFRDKELAND